MACYLLVHWFKGMLLVSSYTISSCFAEIFSSMEYLLIQRNTVGAVYQCMVYDQFIRCVYMIIHSFNFYLHLSFNRVGIIFIVMHFVSFCSNQSFFFNLRLLQSVFTSWLPLSMLRLLKTWVIKGSMCFYNVVKVGCTTFWEDRYLRTKSPS